MNSTEIDTGEFPLPHLDLAPPRPFSSSIHIDVAALTDTGKVREQNEDHYYVARGGRHVTTLLTNVPEKDVPAHFGETAYLMIVADGMGGHAGGEVASRMAIATLINILLHVPDWILRLDDEYAQKVMDRAVARYRQVHESLLETARVNPMLRGMGTTMTAACSLGDDLFVTQVGDSRAYLYRDGALRLLTRDQTQAQLLADRGVISQQEVARHRLRNVLTSALGGSDHDVRVEIQRLKLLDGDRLLLCSDGLTDMVTDERINEILTRSLRSEECCKQLVAEALKNGGKDNITVVLTRYTIPQS